MNHEERAELRARAIGAWRRSRLLRTRTVELIGDAQRIVGRAVLWQHVVDREALAIERMLERDARGLATNGGGPAICTLLIDDDDGYRRLVRRVLEGDGRFAIMAEAVDGADGVGTAIAIQPDLAIVDYHLPLLAGPDVVAELEEFCPRTRIAMLTSMPALAVHTGAHAVFDKIDLPVLADRLAILAAQA